MSQTNPTKISKNESKSRSIESKAKTLSNALVERIISGLSLTQKLDLKSADKRINSCVDRILAKEQSLLFVGTYGKGLDVWTDRQKNRIDLKKIGYNFDDNNQWLVQLMNRFPNIKSLEFDNNIPINNQMFEWLLNRCPHLDSLSLRDYRLNYHSFDWISLGDSLSDRLVSLEIECRFNQHISGKMLSQLISKLELLEELIIVSPQRRLESVFASLGKNITKLEIRYGKCLDMEEAQALVNGNGRRLRELNLHYRTSATGNQNFQFAYICTYLLDLISFSFNYADISSEALSMVTKLSNLIKFKYNCNGVKTNKNRQEFSQNNYQLMDFRYISEPMEMLQSLTLTQIAFIPQYLFNWKNFFPNIRHLHLRCQFECGCRFVRKDYCIQCLKLSFASLAELRSLRSLVFDDPSIPIYSQLLPLFEQIHFLGLNMFEAINFAKMDGILLVLSRMAEYRNDSFAVRLYNLPVDPIPRLRRIRIPLNLKLIFKMNDHLKE